MAPPKVPRRPSRDEMKACPFCHAEFFARGLGNHTKHCPSRHEKLLPTVDLEETVLEGEDGRFDTYLY